MEKNRNGEEVTDRKRVGKNSTLFCHTPSERDTQVDRWIHAFFWKLKQCSFFAITPIAMHNLNKLHTSNTCVCRKVLFLMNKLDLSSIFLSQTSDKKIEAQNFQLVDSFKKFSNEF